MLTAAPLPAVAVRLTQPVVEVNDALLTVADRQHYLFVRAELDPANRLLRVTSIAVVIR